MEGSEWHERLGLPSSGVSTLLLLLGVSLIDSAITPPDSPVYKDGEDVVSPNSEFDVTCGVY